jgi:hypothetical protein
VTQLGAKVKVSADLTVHKTPHVTDGTPCWCLPGYVHGIPMPDAEAILGAVRGNPTVGGQTVNYPANETANSAAST